MDVYCTNHQPAKAVAAALLESDYSEAAALLKHYFLSTCQQVLGHSAEVQHHLTEIPQL